MNNKPRYNRLHKVGMIMCVLSGLEFYSVLVFGVALTQGPQWFAVALMVVAYLPIPTALLSITLFVLGDRKR